MENQALECMMEAVGLIFKNQTLHNTSIINCIVKQVKIYQKK